MKKVAWIAATMSALAAAAAVATLTIRSQVPQPTSSRWKLEWPKMDPQRGKRLFAERGCVVCHQVNGVGGTDAPALDVSTMNPVMSPFDFFAKMWRGAAPMISMQKREIGHQVELSGQDLADIVAFAHDQQSQRSFSERDIPEYIRVLMNGEHDSEQEASPMGMHRHGPAMMTR